MGQGRTTSRAYLMGALAGVLLWCATGPGAAMAAGGPGPVGAVTGDAGTLSSGLFPSEALAGEVGQFLRSGGVGGGAWGTSAPARAAVVVPPALAALRQGGCGCAYASSGILGAPAEGLLWAAEVGQRSRGLAVAVGAWAVSAP